MVRYDIAADSVYLGFYPQRWGDSYDTSQVEHFLTAKGLIEISGSSALASTTGL
jgi:hypothetical protein